MNVQPPTEVVVNAPLRLREEGDEVVVEIHDRADRRVELKRFEHTI